MNAYSIIEMKGLEVGSKVDASGLVILVTRKDRELYPQLSDEAIVTLKYFCLLSSVDTGIESLKDYLKKYLRNKLTPYVLSFMDCSLLKMGTSYYNESMELIESTPEYEEALDSNLEEIILMMLAHRGEWVAEVDIEDYSPEADYSIMNRLYRSLHQRTPESFPCVGTFAYKPFVSRGNQEI